MMRDTTERLSVEFWHKRGRRKGGNDYRNHTVFPDCSDYCIVVTPDRATIIYDSRTEFPCQSLRGPLPDWLTSTITTPVVTDDKAFAYMREHGVNDRDEANRLIVEQRACIVQNKAAAA